MNPELSALLERLKQKRQALELEARDARERRRCASSPLGCALERGAHVFDPQTGQIGVVVDGTRENVIVQPANRRDD